MINHVGFRYEVMSKISMTMGNLIECMITSEKHYDGVCKRASKVGGFLYGMKNLFDFTILEAIELEQVVPEVFEVEINEYDLQTLCKILEQKTEDPHIYSEATSIFRQNHAEYRRLNNIEN